MAERAAGSHHRSVWFHIAVTAHAVVRWKRRCCGEAVQGPAGLPLEGKADADPAETPGSASSSTFALVDLLSPVLNQSSPWNGLCTRSAGVLHARLKFSLSVIGVTDLLFFFPVIYVRV